MPDIVLRRYQLEAKKAILQSWDTGNKNTLLVLPTGCGKTVVIAAIAEEMAKKNHRVLILAHREELLSQAAATVKRVANLECSVEKAKQTCLGSDRLVTIGSVQTLANKDRLSRFPEDYYHVIIVDEAHHALSETYRRVLDHFPKALVLGVTATPERGDQQDLGKIFHNISYEYSIVQAIREGFLCPVNAQMIPLRLDIGGVSVSHGDFDPEDLGNKLDPFLEQIALEMLDLCKNRKTVVFLPLIKTSKKFCKILNRLGLKAAEINGMSVDREELLNGFRDGKYDVLCNSMLLTEGWDCPAVNCIVVLRPTKIRSLYQQMVGRGMRPYPGKDHLLLLDFLWLTEQHDLCRPSMIFSADESEIRELDDKLRHSPASIELIRASEPDPAYSCNREDTLAKSLTAVTTRERKNVDPLYYAMVIDAEDLAEYRPSAPWESNPATKKQMRFLEQRGISPEAVKSAGMAAKLIDLLISRQKEGLATPKQIRCLESFGFRHVGIWHFDDAKETISQLANNKWRIPTGMTPETYDPFKRRDNGRKECY